MAKRKTITLSDTELHAKLENLKNESGVEGWNELLNLLYQKAQARKVEFSGKQYVENFILDCLANTDTPEKITVQRIYKARQVNRANINKVFKLYEKEITAYNAKL